MIILGLLLFTVRGILPPDYRFSRSCAAEVREVLVESKEIRFVHAQSADAPKDKLVSQRAR